MKVRMAAVCMIRVTNLDFLDEYMDDPAPFEFDW